MPRLLATFSCQHCGKHYSWNPQQAGGSFTCECGQNVAVAPEPLPQDQAYDLSPQPESQPPTKTKVLAYQRPTQPENSALMPRDVMLQKLYSPIAMIFAGLVMMIIKLLCVSTNKIHLLSIAQTLSILLAWEMVSTFGALYIAFRILGVAFTSTAEALLKIAAVVILPMGIWNLFWIISPNLVGYFGGYFLYIAAAWWLYRWVFELNFDELLTCIAFSMGFHWALFFIGRGFFA